MSDSNSANSSSDDDTGHVVALAVGLGVSIPVAAVIIILLWLFIRHRRVAREEDERHKDIDMEGDISMMPPPRQHGRNYSIADTETEKESFAPPPRNMYSQGVETDDSSTYMYTPYMNEEAQRSIDGFSKSLHSLLGPSPMYPSMDRLGAERVGTSGSSLSSMPIGEPNSPRRLSAHGMGGRANFSLDNAPALPPASEDDVLDDEDSEFTHSEFTHSEMGSPVRSDDPRVYQRRSIPDSLSMASSQLPIASEPRDHEPEPELPPVPAPRVASPVSANMRSNASLPLTGSQTALRSRTASPAPGSSPAMASSAASGNATATAAPAPGIPGYPDVRDSMLSTTSLHTAASHMRSKQSLLPESGEPVPLPEQHLAEEPVQLAYQPSVATVRPGEGDVERTKSVGQQAVHEIYGKYGDTSYESDDGHNDTPADRSTVSGSYDETVPAKAEPYNESADASANSGTYMLDSNDTSYSNAPAVPVHGNKIDAVRPTEPRQTQAPAPSLQGRVLPPIQTQHGDASYFPPADVSYAPSIAASSQYSGYAPNVTSPVAPQSPFADMELPNVPAVKGLPRAPSLPDIKNSQRAPVANWGRPAVSPDFQTFGVPAPPPTRSGQPRLQISHDGQSYSQPQSPMLESPASPAPSSSISQRAPNTPGGQQPRSQVTMDQSVFFEAPRKFGNKGRGIPAASKLG